YIIINKNNYNIYYNLIFFFLYFTFISLSPMQNQKESQQKDAQQLSNQTKAVVVEGVTTPDIATEIILPSSNTKGNASTTAPSEKTSDSNNIANITVLPTSTKSQRNIPQNGND